MTQKKFEAIEAGLFTVLVLVVAFCIWMLMKFVGL